MFRATTTTRRRARRDDNDGALDGADDCPLIANADQLAFDGDGQDDVRDDDADGVADENDLCPGTPMNVAFDPTTGCSGTQWVDSQAPCGGDWRNHGQYQSAVVAAANRARDASLLTNQRTPPPYARSRQERLRPLSALPPLARSAAPASPEVGAALFPHALRPPDREPAYQLSGRAL
ncbi:MAG: hypothetical protein KC620_05890 [Myxococcales bacterium]|nr:hypothetical protein [Myxococcales bacterium]